MSAATELRLYGSAPLPRELSITLNSRRLVTATLYVPFAGVKRQLAFALGDLTECYLSLGRYDNALWVRGAAFDVTQAEALRIRAMFESLGLEIQTEQPFKNAKAVSA